jgi:hypothetical protein
LARESFLGARVIYKENRARNGGHIQARGRKYRIVVRGVRRQEPDIKKLARVLIDQGLHMKQQADEDGHKPAA